MVTSTVTETKDACEYSLEAVHRLADFQQVRFMYRRIQRHLDVLGYEIGEVCAHLGNLRESNFVHSERYVDDKRWHDVYFLPHPVPENVDERLYIKFRVDRHCVWIELCSFHPEGWI